MHTSSQGSPLHSLLLFKLTLNHVFTNSSLLILKWRFTNNKKSSSSSKLKFSKLTLSEPMSMLTVSANLCVGVCVERGEGISTVTYTSLLFAKWEFSCFFLKPGKECGESQPRLHNYEHVSFCTREK